MDHWRSYAGNSDILLKRGIGIGFAIFALAANRYFSGGTVNSHTHPHPVDRLLRYFDYLETSQSGYASEVTRLQYAACICLYGTVAPHLPPASLTKQFPNPRDCVEYLRKNFRPISV